MDPTPTTPRGAAATHTHVHRVHPLLTRRDRLVATVFLMLATGLVPWTVYLSLSLPPKYNAGHWDLLWTGFDGGLILVLGYAAWAAWYRRQIVATTSLVAGTLLLSDAWFDIVTSIGHRDQWVTLLTGLGGELPLAFFFLWLYRLIVLKSLATLHRLIHDGPPPRRLSDAHILFLSGNPPVVSDAPGPRSP